MFVSKTKYTELEEDFKELQKKYEQLTLFHVAIIVHLYKVVNLLNTLTKPFTVSRGSVIKEIVAIRRETEKLIVEDKKIK